MSTRFFLVLVDLIKSKFCGKISRSVADVALLAISMPGLFLDAAGTEASFVSMRMAYLKKATAV